MQRYVWYYVLSKIWRNMRRDMEIDRNGRFENLLKLVRGQKIFYSRDQGGDSPISEKSENFHF